jgi:hypothetical protein
MAQSRFDERKYRGNHQVKERKEIKLATMNKRLSYID